MRQCGSVQDPKTQGSASSATNERFYRDLILWDQRLESLYTITRIIRHGDFVIFFPLCFLQLSELSLTAN